MAYKKLAFSSLIAYKKLAFTYKRLALAYKRLSFSLINY